MSAVVRQTPHPNGPSTASLMMPSQHPPPSLASHQHRQPSQPQRQPFLPGVPPITTPVIHWKTPEPHLNEPSPEQQLRENLRFVRGSGSDGRRPKQPLYRPAVLRRTESNYMLASSSTPAGSPPYSPEASMASMGRDRDRDGTSTPDLQRGHRNAPERGDCYEWPAIGGQYKETRCGSAVVNGKLVGRMMDKADWTPDSFRSVCSDDRCVRRFGLFERKHHCRLCGEVFCGSCSSQRVELLPPSRRAALSTSTRASDSVDQPLSPALTGPALASALSHPLVSSTASPTVGDSVSSAPSPSTPSAVATPASPTPSASATLSVPPTPPVAQAPVLALTSVLLLCRVCDTCASSLALGIDPLATRARKPLLESSTSFTPNASSGSMFSPSLPVPLSGAATARGMYHQSPSGGASSPVGSMGSRASGSAGRRSSGASAQRDARDQMAGSDPNVARGSADSNTSGSSHYSLATPPPTGAPPHRTASMPAPTVATAVINKTKGFYHPFPHGAEPLFALSPSSLGGVVIPTAPQYGQVWEAEVKDEDGETEVGSVLNRRAKAGETSDEGELVPGSYSWSTF